MILKINKYILFRQRGHRDSEIVRAVNINIK